MKTSRTAITLALTASLGSTGIAVANENPFVMQVLDQGYQVAETNTPDGKCGASKTEEGKCGGKKVEDGKSGADKAATKGNEGKCGEGKCGASKDKPAESSPE